ncbi:hypothetical protein PUN28_008738 [Cardiocondyla obscurior]|uniref:Uncharacterized protein n=1 Tax=Cardiocondyla obscurior TaxID=286306 RepID=A0AAW2G4B4_9HYME
MRNTLIINCLSSFSGIFDIIFGIFVRSKTIVGRYVFSDFLVHFVTFSRKYNRIIIPIIFFGKNVHIRDNNSSTKNNCKAEKLHLFNCKYLRYLHSFNEHWTVKFPRVSDVRLGFFESTSCCIIDNTNNFIITF